MILDVRDPQQAHLFPCRIIDADKREIMFAVRVDTVTGEVLKRKINKHGMFYQDLLKPKIRVGDKMQWQSATELLKFKAPLKIVMGSPTFKTA